MSIVTTVAELEAIYGAPGEPSTVKVADRLTPHYRTLLEAAPFAVLGTSGPEGLDCSPRGERTELVRVVDERTLQMPDRRGNNRIDSLRNIVRDPRVALLFLIPGAEMTLRINGTAHVSIDRELCASFAIEERTPRSVIEIAIVRSELWNPAHFLAETALPSAGAILAAQSNGRVGGDAYEKDRATRQRESLW